jgi:hypothetical protein
MVEQNRQICHGREHKLGTEEDCWTSLRHKSDKSLGTDQANRPKFGTEEECWANQSLLLAKSM